jgi:hypothetical protein
MALSDRCCRASECRLLGELRKWSSRARNNAIDPFRTSLDLTRRPPTSSCVWALNVMGSASIRTQEEHMKRYLYVMLLYAFSPIFLSTNLYAAGWACAAATGPPESARYLLGQNPKSTQSRNAAVAASMAGCAQMAKASGLPNNCRVLDCWVRTIGDPFCSVVSAHHYHIPACQ